VTKTVEHPLGRLEPSDFKHVELYPLTAVLPETVDYVERLLQIPGWRVSHDQGSEGSCVGHAVALERAIVNRMQLVAAGRRETVRYDPIDLWNEAKRVDEWEWTLPGDTNGTSVRAAYDVAQARGLSRVSSMKLVDGVPRPFGAKAADVAHGVTTFRWAHTVDEVRSAIAAGLPVAIGVNWHRGFDTPVYRSSAYWLPTLAAGIGAVRGGHAVCLSGASDAREAFRLVNSWGRDYPLVWLPYETMGFLLDQAGEAAVVTDR
jgi:hypothetical protein